VAKEAIMSCARALALRMENFIMVMMLVDAVRWKNDARSGGY
jgi:hypothetical protein